MDGDAKHGVSPMSDQAQTTPDDDPYNEFLWGGDFDERQEAELDRKNTRVSSMTEPTQTTYHVLYRPAGEWQRYEVTAVDLNMARMKAERLAPKGYELDRIDVTTDPMSMREDALVAEIERLRSHIASLNYIPLRYRDRPPGFIEARRKVCDTPHICFEFGDHAPVCGPCDTAVVKAIYQERQP